VQRLGQLENTYAEVVSNKNMAQSRLAALKSKVDALPPSSVAVARPATAPGGPVRPASGAAPRQAPDAGNPAARVPDPVHRRASAGAHREAADCRRAEGARGCGEGDHPGADRRQHRARSGPLRLRGDHGRPGDVQPLAERPGGGAARADQRFEEEPHRSLAGRARVHQARHRRGVEPPPACHALRKAVRRADPRAGRDEGRQGHRSAERARAGGEPEAHPLPRRGPRARALHRAGRACGCRVLQPSDRDRRGRAQPHRAARAREHSAGAVTPLDVHGERRSAGRREPGGVLSSSWRPSAASAWRFSCSAGRPPCGAL
jgi:hypothetical protein